MIVLAFVMVAGTVGYLALGAGLLDAIYRTVVTITTVGFESRRPLNAATKGFTIVLILVGVGTALYTFSAVLEVLIEGHMRERVRRHRMERDIAAMSGHVVICGWGRVGRAVAHFLSASRCPIVIIDRNEERVRALPYPSVVGDVTDDQTLLAAGIEWAATLVAALDTDGDNLYVTVACRSLRPDLQIIARARSESSEPKLLRAGADRVVNPQKLGGDRMASFVTQPHVVDFIDVVMHDRTFEFRLEEQQVPAGSGLVGESLRSAQVRDKTGALVLAVRRADGTFVTNPSPELVIEEGDVLISVGTAGQLKTLGEFVSVGSVGYPGQQRTGSRRG